MILTCPACSTRYQADAAKFPSQGRDVRCAKCGHLWHQLPPGAEPQVEAEPEPVVVPPQAEAFDAPAPESFAETRVRDLQPQPAPAYDEPGAKRPAAEEPAAVPASKRRRSLALTAGWLGLGVIVVAVFACAFFFRQQIAGAWPQSASLYAALGMKVNTSGLEFVDYAYHQDVQGGQTVLTVTGSIRNITAHELPVPPIRVALTDEARRELYHWTFAPEVMTLRAGQTTRFVTRLSSPPQGARQLSLRFAKSGE